MKTIGKVWFIALLLIVILAACSPSGQQELLNQDPFHECDYVMVTGGALQGGMSFSSPVYFFVFPGQSVYYQGQLDNWTKLAARGTFDGKEMEVSGYVYGGIVKQVCK